MTSTKRKKLTRDLSEHEALRAAAGEADASGGAGLTVRALRGDPGAPKNTRDYLRVAVHWTGGYLKASGDQKAPVWRFTSTRSTE